MSISYAKGKPIGNNSVPFQDAPPPYIALATNVRDNAAASSILILTHDTTALEVAARGGPAYIKFLTQATVDSSVAGTSVISAVGTANFDFAIPADTVRRFVLPIATINNDLGYSSQVGANIANGLYRHVATITGAIASVATTQY